MQLKQLNSLSNQYFHPMKLTKHGLSGKLKATGIIISYFTIFMPAVMGIIKLTTQKNLKNSNVKKESKLNSNTSIPRPKPIAGWASTINTTSKKNDSNPILSSNGELSFNPKDRISRDGLCWAVKNSDRITSINVYANGKIDDEIVNELIKLSKITALAISRTFMSLDSFNKLTQGLPNLKEIDIRDLWIIRSEDEIKKGMNQFLTTNEIRELKTRSPSVNFLVDIDDVNFASENEKLENVTPNCINADIFKTFLFPLIDVDSFLNFIHLDKASSNMIETVYGENMITKVKIFKKALDLANANLDPHRKVSDLLKIASSLRSLFPKQAGDICREIQEKYIQGTSGFYLSDEEIAAIAQRQNDLYPYIAKIIALTDTKEAIKSLDNLKEILHFNVVSSAANAHKHPIKEVHLLDLADVLANDPEKALLVLDSVDNEIDRLSLPPAHPYTEKKIQIDTRFQKADILKKIALSIEKQDIEKAKKLREDASELEKAALEPKSASHAYQLSVNQGVSLLLVQADTLDSFDLLSGETLKNMMSDLTKADVKPGMKIRLLAKTAHAIALTDPKGAEKIFQEALNIAKFTPGIGLLNRFALLKKLQASLWPRNPFAETLFKEMDQVSKKCNNVSLNESIECYKAIYRMQSGEDKDFSALKRAVKNTENINNLLVLADAL